MSLPTLDDNSVDDLYKWLSAVPLSRHIKNIAKDFSDGVLVAELIAHFLPRYVSLANYTPVNSNALKRYNWETLNKMVFVHLNFSVNQSLIQKVTTCQPGAIEFVLFRLRQKIDEAVQEGRFRPSRHRSRSAAGRTGSTTSLSNADSESNLLQMTSSVHIDPDCTNHAIRAAAAAQHYQTLCNAEGIVSLQKYHQAQQELLARDEQIQKLYARIRHLERLVQLKDERIVEISRQMEKMMHVICRDQIAASQCANEYGSKPQQS
ncbi:Sperm flagellar protein 1 [Toxocara canis]|uniref:Sperm flagellar protein 1 n=2 Tax=Toxocara canis TaxID=6265 RepID=A0A0B2V1R5_TOXCA|nr:Sperm flagellar protein 1 [Toxocara canis]